MRTDRKWHDAAALSGLFFGGANAAPIEGETSSNAAVLLVLLGVWALLMGLRNLRQLRHKHLVLNREAKDSGTRQMEDPNPETQG